MIKIEHKESPVEINNCIKNRVDIWGRDYYGDLNWLSVPRENLKLLIKELTRIEKTGREKPSKDI